MQPRTLFLEAEKNDCSRRWKEVKAGKGILLWCQKDSKIDACSLSLVRMFKGEPPPGAGFSSLTWGCQGLNLGPSICKGCVVCYDGAHPQKAISTVVAYL